MCDHDTRALARIVRVNHAFRCVAEPMLYDTVEAECDNATIAFCDSVLSYPRLGSLIRALHIRDIEGIDQRLIHQLPLLLHSLCNIRELTIRMNCYWSCDTLPILDALNSVAALSNLQAFSTNLIFTSSSIASFLDAHPVIEHLESTRSLLSPGGHTYTVIQLPSTLLSLACTPQVFRVITKEAHVPRALSHLHLLHAHGQILAYAARLLGSQLVALRVGSRAVTEADGNWPLGTVVREFPHLRLLHVDMRHVRVPVPPEIRFC